MMPLIALVIFIILAVGWWFYVVSADLIINIWK